MVWGLQILQERGLDLANLFKLSPLDILAIREEIDRRLGKGSIISLDSRIIKSL